MLASVGRAQHQLLVVSRRHADVDGVDVGRVDDLRGVGDSLGARDPGEGAGAVRVLVADGDVLDIEQLAADDGTDGGGVKAADEAAADEANPDGHDERRLVLDAAQQPVEAGTEERPQCFLTLRRRRTAEAVAAD